MIMIHIILNDAKCHIYFTAYLKIGEAMFPYDVILQDFHFPGKKGMITGYSHSVLPRTTNGRPTQEILTNQLEKSFTSMK